MSLFQNAVKLPTNDTKAKSKDRGDVVQLDGLEEIAKINAVSKTFETLYEEASTSMKDEVISDMFYGAMIKDGKFPENFKAEDGIASASIECRKRGENQPFSEDEEEVLADHGLVAERKIVKQELWAINPKYATDKVVMKKIETLLKGKVPDDLFAYQAEESKAVVTPKLLEEACAKKAKLPKEVFLMLSTLAIKPKLEVTDLKALFSEMKTLLGIDEEDEEVIRKSPVKKATKAVLSGKVTTTAKKKTSKKAVA